MASPITPSGGREQSWLRPAKDVSQGQRKQTELQAGNHDLHDKKSRGLRHVLLRPRVRPHRKVNSVFSYVMRTTSGSCALRQAGVTVKTIWTAGGSWVHRLPFRRDQRFQSCVRLPDGGYILGIRSAFNHRVSRHLAKDQYRDGWNTRSLLRLAVWRCAPRAPLRAVPIC